MPLLYHTGEPRVKGFGTQPDNSLGNLLGKYGPATDATGEVERKNKEKWNIGISAAAE